MYIADDGRNGQQSSSSCVRGQSSRPCTQTANRFVSFSNMNYFSFNLSKCKLNKNSCDTVLLSSRIFHLKSTFSWFFKKVTTYNLVFGCSFWHFTMSTGRRNQMDYIFLGSNLLLLLTAEISKWMSDISLTVDFAHVKVLWWTIVVFCISSKIDHRAV